MGAVLSSLNTYALLAASKVVVLNDARLFYSTKARQRLRENMEAAAQSGDMKKASRPFLNLLSLSKMQFEDLNNTAMRTQIADDLEERPAPWFSRLMEYCREKGLKIPTQHDDADLLKAAMDKGFPRPALPGDDH
jgi:DNA polymerase-3 subunit delta